jgi:hypothetical protein
VPIAQFSTHNNDALKFVVTGMFFGQYVSQYDARSLATPGIPQNLQASQLLVGYCGDSSGVTAIATANAMKMRAQAYCDSSSASTSSAYMTWMKAEIRAQHPVILGLFINQYLDSRNTNARAGDSNYDHIILITGVDSSFTDTVYHGADIIHFDDHLGQQYFSLASNFARSRTAANGASAPYYSIDTSASYALSVLGIQDTDGSSLRVQVSHCKLYFQYSLSITFLFVDNSFVLAE